MLRILFGVLVIRIHISFDQSFFVLNVASKYLKSLTYSVLQYKLLSTVLTKIHNFQEIEFILFLL